MQVIILAAGMGKRLGDLTQCNTKCMVKVNGVTLIERLLRQLETVKSLENFSRIVVVTGYQGAKLREFINNLDISTPIEYVDNPIYATTNNIYSLFLAKDYMLKEDTLLFESDLIFEDCVIDCIVRHPYPNLALVAKFESWMDGTVVTLDEHDNIKSFIPSSKFSWLSSAEYFKTVNIYKFSKEFSTTYYVPFLTAYSKALGNNEYYEQVLRVIALLDKPELKALRLRDELWYEIDDVQDLDIAESMFCKPDDKLKKMEKRYGGYWRYPHILDFSHSMNSCFPNNRLMSELQANLNQLVRGCPSGMSVNSLLVGKYFGIKQDYVCVGNGSSELIKELLRTLEGNLGVILPTCEEYLNRMTTKRLVPFVPKNGNFSYTAADLESFYTSKDISALLVVNPDNPSGNFLTRVDVLRLCAWSKNEGICLIVDESFVDFSEDTTRNTMLTNEILESYPHLVVIKSISNSYGVPGLRLGLLATGNKDFIAAVKKNVSIWNINSLGEFFMQILGKYEKDYYQSCEQVINERVRFMQALESIDFLRVVPSQANYFLCEVLPPFTSRGLSEYLLERHDVLLKDCSCKKAMEEKSYVRISVRNRSDNDYLVATMIQLMKNCTAS